MNGCIKNSHRTYNHRTYNHRTYTSVCLSALICLLLPGTASGRNDIGVTEPTVAEPAFSAKAALPAEMDLTVTTIPFNTQSYDGIYTLGGVRLKLTLNQSSLSTEDQTEIPNIIWTFGQAGRICTDMNMLADNSNCQVLPLGFDYQRPDNTATTDNEQFTVYWEPLDWTLGMNVIVTARTDNGDRVVTGEHYGTTLTVSYPESRFELLLSTRPLGPAADGEEPTEGSDVKMLEQMLWQLGISPQVNNPGSEGARINSVRNSAGTLTSSCITDQPQRRDAFLSYASVAGCSATELMVKRFNARNLDIGTAVTRDEVASARGNVNAETLGWLERDWDSYMDTYSTQSAFPVFERTTGNMPTWVEEAANILRNGSGDHVPATLTDTLYNQILGQAGLERNSRTQDQLLTAWLEEESRYHWGSNNKGYQATDYRMNEGGADENGSLSFSQVLYHYRYGANPCTAQKDAALNFYHPGNNLKAMIIHAASDNTDTDTTQNCEGGLHKAFVRNTLKSTYDQVAAGETMEELRGYKHPGQGTVTTVQLTGQEDDYEGLAKAIGIYNSNGTDERPIFTNRSWAGRLRYMEYNANSTENSPTVCHSCKYTLKVRNKAATFQNHLRQYVWQGGTGLDLNGDGTIATTPNMDGVIESEVPWCFGYGESEWLTGTTWQSVSDAALDRNPDTGEVQVPQGRVECKN